MGEGEFIPSMTPPEILTWELPTHVNAGVLEFKRIVPWMITQVFEERVMFVSPVITGAVSVITTTFVRDEFVPSASVYFC